MNKSNKELTAEVVSAFLTAWGSRGLKPTDREELPSLIKLVFNAFQALDEDSIS